MGNFPKDHFKVVATDIGRKIVPIRVRVIRQYLLSHFMRSRFLTNATFFPVAALRYKMGHIYS